jgi:trk system potassium uptake protein TrkH
MNNNCNVNQRILANLGFLLQTAGLLTLLPIGVGFAFGETEALMPLFITCITFLGVGFLLNALCERKDLNVKSSSMLLFAAFIILPLISAIPYLFMDPFNNPNLLDRFTNSLFESVSGFTTTGFSFIADTTALPKCILVFRSLTELMGGVGLVFLVLAFFQSKRALPKLSNILGIDNINRNLKKMFFFVFLVYTIYIIVFTLIFYAMGYTNVVVSSSFVIDTITGGFSPSTAHFEQYLSVAPKILMIIMMFVGSVNFAFHYNLVSRKIKKSFSLETGVFVALLACASLAVALAAKIDFLDSTFHVVSLAATAGGTYIEMSALNADALSILMIVMLIGGCAFSMAGGIKVSRLITLGTVFGNQLKMTFARTKKPQKKESEPSEAFSAIEAILLFTAVLVVFSLLFSTIGIPLQNAFFEVGSALSTTGATMGAVTVTMPVAYKWLIIAAMTIGKVEILTVIAIVIPFASKKLKRKTIA